MVATGALVTVAIAAAALLTEGKTDAQSNTDANKEANTFLKIFINKFGLSTVNQTAFLRASWRY
jgi:hypothetical protein